MCCGFYWPRSRYDDYLVDQGLLRLTNWHCLATVPGCGAKPVSRSNSHQLLRVVSGWAAIFVCLGAIAYQAAQYRHSHTERWRQWCHGFTSQSPVNKYNMT